MEDVLDRTTWKNNIQYHAGDTRRWGKPEEKERTAENTLYKTMTTWHCLTDLLIAFVSERGGVYGLARVDSGVA